MNPMQNIQVEKVTLNIGSGVNQENLKKAMQLLKNLTGMEPIKTISNKRIPSWGVRPGLPLGCKLTVRGKKAEELLKRLLSAKDNKLKITCFDNYGNISFGIQEYIDVPNLDYDASLGMMGFQVSVTLSRPGFRVKLRRKLNRKIGKTHRVTQKDSIKYFTKTLKVQVE